MQPISKQRPTAPPKAVTPTTNARPTLIAASSATALSGVSVSVTASSGCLGRLGICTFHRGHVPHVTPGVLGAVLKGRGSFRRDSARAGEAEIVGRGLASSAGARRGSAREPRPQPRRYLRNRENTRGHSVRPSAFGLSVVSSAGFDKPLAGNETLSARRPYQDRLQPCGRFEFDTTRCLLPETPDDSTAA